jgi:hypothetical protein
MTMAKGTKKTAKAAPKKGGKAKPKPKPMSKAY